MPSAWPVLEAYIYKNTTCWSATAYDVTHNLCVFCLGKQHAHNVLEGKICVHCEFLSMKKLRSRLSLFSRKEGQPSASRDLGPTAAKARRRMKSWNSQLDMADELERDCPLFARRPRTRVSCWIVMMRSFWHHQMQQLVLRCIWTSFWRLWIIKINLNNPQLEWAFLSS